MEVMHLSNLSKDEAVELGSKVAALIGLGIDGEEGMIAGAELGAEAAAEHGIEVFSDEEAWDVLEEIPNDSAAALILLEHPGPWGCATRSCGQRRRHRRQLHPPGRSRRDRSRDRGRGRGVRGDAPEHGACRLVAPLGGKQNTQPRRYREMMARRVARRTSRRTARRRYRCPKPASPPEQKCPAGRSGRKRSTPHPPAAQPGRRGRHVANAIQDLTSPQHSRT